jgi:hypothetical protein
VDAGYSANSSYLDKNILSGIKIIGIRVRIPNITKPLASNVRGLSCALVLGAHRHKQTSEYIFKAVKPP